MKDCIFCQIAEGTIESKKLLENDDFVAVKDINPKAKVHLLIIPKRHIEKPSELNKTESLSIFKFALDAAQKTRIEDGYRLVFNVGKKVGQEIDHVHMHLLGGQPPNALY